MMSRTRYLHKILPFTLLLLFLLPSPCPSADRKSVVLLPLTFYADPGKAYLREGLRNMFLSRLSGEDLVVIGDDLLDPLLTEADKKGVSSGQRAEELAGDVDADYAIFGSVTSLGAGYSLDLSILDLTKDEPDLTKISEAVDEDQLITKVADIVYDFRAVVAGVDIRKRGPAGAQQESPYSDETLLGLFFEPTSRNREFSPRGTLSVNILIMGMDTGDLNGDGQAEVVVVGRDKLLVYGKKEETYALLGTLEPAFSEDYLKVSVGDADQNGKAEIYAVSRYGIRARTTIWEWDGQFKKLDQLSGHLRAVRHPTGGTPLLLFQDSLMRRFFSGPVTIMDYKGPGRLVPKETLKPEGGIQFYTVAFFDLEGDGIPEIVGLNDNDRLCVWNQDATVLWRSEDKVGGTNNAIDLKEVFEEDRPYFTYFNSSIALLDIDGDGKKEVLTPKNIPMIKHLEYFRVYPESNMIAYKVEGGGLSARFSSRKIKYCVTDVQAEGKTVFLAVQKAKITKIGSGSGRIMWFE